MKNFNLSKCFMMVIMMLASAYSAIAQQKADGLHNTLKSSGFASVNGLDIYYEVHGEGEPIILLHGAYMTINLNWGQLIPELSKTRRVIAMELQGHGRTADSERPFSYQDLAGDVAGVMKHLKIDRADVLGYSFGGTVALQLAIQNPELVNKLVIMSTVYKYDGWLPEVREALASFQPEFFDSTPLKTEYDRVAPDPKHWHTFVSKFMQFDTDEHFNLGEENVKSIQSPTLLVMGDNDGVDLKHKLDFYKLLGGDVFGDIAGLPQSQLAIIPGMTHVGLMMETDKIHSIINHFLKTNKHTMKHDLTVTRVFNVPVEEVWKAWSESKYVKQWWGPQGFTAPVANMDFREDGTSFVCMNSPQYGTLCNTWTYTKIKPMERIEFTLNWADEKGQKVDPAGAGMPPDLPYEVPHEITIKNLGAGKTELIVSEYGYSTEEMADRSKMGLEQCLDKMAAIFAKN